MMIPVGTSPIPAAVEAFARRTGVASPLRSAGWAEMAVGLRQQAYWSSGVEFARFISESRAKLLAAITGQKIALDNGQTVTMDKSRFVRHLRSLVLGARASGELTDQPGTPLTDIANATRLRLIYDMNTRLAFGEARWRRQQDPNLLHVWPAQELSLSTAKNPRTREYWLTRWFKAAQDSGDLKAGEIADETDRLVALKTSPLWTALSRFELPWPPFDYGSQRRLKNVTRSDAIALGLMTPTQTITPIAETFDRNLAASAATIAPEERQALKTIFGPQLEIDGNTLKWKADLKGYETAIQQERLSAGQLAAQLRVEGLSSPDQISAVVRDRKHLYLQGTRTLASAESIRDTLKDRLQPDIAVEIIRSGESFFIVAWKPELTGYSKKDIELALATGDSWKMLGYGGPYNAPGAREVSIQTPEGTPLTGFQAPGNKANLFATARTLDFTRSGTPATYRLSRPRFPNRDTHHSPPPP